MAPATSPAPSPAAGMSSRALPALAVSARALAATRPCCAFLPEELQEQVVDLVVLGRRDLHLFVFALGRGIPSFAHLNCSSLSPAA
eukprot:CAMPEP_0171101756 /NCGR_PEP_ID=MMETSP0766_2-20121228/55886_1 /TAXON_ID=439317 /ORGANISM="Gambierdiscus australes, Strain CAWD 149" /LENGTH=85 /DNA_ID=CAMNT_0011561883 /DNA_START=231 /DNA_END=484 /DNA_ORIENTATION=+